MKNIFFIFFILLPNVLFSQWWVRDTAYDDKFFAVDSAVVMGHDSLMFFSNGKETNVYLDSLKIQSSQDSFSIIIYKMNLDGSKALIDTFMATTAKHNEFENTFVKRDTIEAGGYYYFKKPTDTGDFAITYWIQWEQQR